MLSLQQANLKGFYWNLETSNVFEYSNMHALTAILEQLVTYLVFAPNPFHAKIWQANYTCRVWSYAQTPLLPLKPHPSSTCLLY